jgi:hypothetical protein
MGAELQRSYSEEDVERGLITLAECGGNAAHAHRKLKNQGHTIPQRTLHNWKNGKYAARYIEIREERLPEILGNLSDDYQRVAAESLLAAAESVEEFRKKKGDLTAKELSTAARDLTVAGATATDKLLIINNRPTQITKTEKTADEMLLSVMRLVGGAIDGEAIEDAELVEGNE